MKKLVFLVLPVLAACGEGSSFEREFKKSYRDNGIKACVVAARASSGGRAPDDLLTRLCTCTTDRAMANRSAQELMGLRPDGPEIRGAAEQCLREHAPNAAAATVGAADRAAGSAVAAASGAASRALDRAAGALPGGEGAPKPAG